MSAVPRPMSNVPCRPSGVSLIIAIIFVSVFLLMLANMTAVQLATLRSVGHITQQAKVRNLANSAEELGKFWAAVNADGQNSADVWDLSAGRRPPTAIDGLLRNLESSLGYANCDSDPAPNATRPCVGFEVVGRARSQFNGAQNIYNAQQVVLNNAQYYSAPIRGTGDAGRGCERATEPALRDADHPCNWNRLYLGESAEVPLFYVNGAGAVVKAGRVGGPALDLKVRIRPPCAVGGATNNFGPFSQIDENGGAGCTRMQLFPMQVPLGTQNAPYRNPVLDPVLVQWIVSDVAGRESLVAGDDRLANGFRDTDPVRNTEISGGRISDAANNGPQLQDSTMLEAQFSGKNVITDLPQPIGTFLAQGAVARPMLRLTLVTTPQREEDTNQTNVQDRNNTQLNLPYLEYQVLSTSEISDTKAFIKGYAQVGDFRREFSAVRKRPTTIGGFAFESF